MPRTGSGNAIPSGSPPSSGSPGAGGPPSTTHIWLEGQVERVTFASDAGDWTVAKLKVRGRSDLVTVVGRFPAPVPGELLRLGGAWTDHPHHGEQFTVQVCQSRLPATAEGIRRYLGSGLIKGIGPVMAGRIVKAFGDKALDVIDREPARLREIKGLGRGRAEMIAQAWSEQREIREVMVFLQSHGVSPAYATRIWKRYGAQAAAVVSENPYRLAQDVWGIGFLTADRVAREMGFALDSPFRAKAGVLHTLLGLADEGHVFAPRVELLKAAGALLGQETGTTSTVDAAVEALAGERAVVLDYPPGLHGEPAVYLASYHLCETRVAQALRALLATPRSVRSFDVDSAVGWVQGRLGLTLAGRQLEAVAAAARHKVCVLTGGPGTGKTTIVRAVVLIFAALGRVLLAAPTGRAAKRLSEATHRPAATLHRLLEYDRAKGGFSRNESRPLDCDLLVVDEASMLDATLAHHLLKAVPRGAGLVLVGDVNQLPSVGPGNVLGDVIASGAVPVVTLTEIFRQAKESDIVVNAHRVNQGRMPRSRSEAEGLGDFYFVEREDPEQVREMVLTLVQERIPARFGLDPLEDVQVLCPMNRGELGTRRLNEALRERLNPTGPELARGDRAFRVGDKVMQLRNNYDKDVFNGDVGRVRAVDTQARECQVLFDGRPVVYAVAELDELSLAYAVSVHKSQGSEYPAVVMPILTQHYVMLRRNLLYTAMTRGRKLVVLVGSKRALGMAVSNAKAGERHTGLAWRLAGGGAAGQAW